MHDQPYYFELVPRAIISKSSEKQQGQFRFHVYKTTQQVDFTRQGLNAEFDQRRMQINNVKLNFFLPNYIAGKNTNAKFTFQLSKKPKHTSQKQVGSYSIDANIYIEQFKKTQQNHFAQLWQLSENYSVEVKIFFQESRYLLQQLLKMNKSRPAGEFSKALVSKALEKAKKEELEEQQEYENEQKYSEKRTELLNKYSGAIVGHGGYRIFTEEEQEQKLQKKLSQQSRKQENASIKKDMKMAQSIDSRPKIKRTQSITMGNPLHEEQFSQNQIKNIKYLILLVLILIVTGTVYFTSKVFLKDQPVQSLSVENVDNNNEENYRSGKKSSRQKQKKPKSKKSKKGQL